MKVLVLTLLCIALTVAVPVDIESNDDTQLTLADIDNEPIFNENIDDVARSKRFILKKIALAKVGALGIGALGVAGAAVAARGTFGNMMGYGQQSTPSQNYGYGYNYNSAPMTTLTTGTYPSTGYYTNQNVVPSTYTTGYNTETAAYGSGIGYSGPSVQTGNIGGYAGPSVASANIGYAGPSFSVQSQIQPYDYRSVPLPPQGKAVYVVCDQQH